MKEGEVRVNSAELQRLRHRLRWSQKWLETKSGIGQSHISRLEQGRRQNVHIETVVKLARALGVSVDDLIIGAAPAEEIKPITVYETLQPASAGPGVFAEGEAWAYFPEPYEKDHHFVVVPVSGTCMEPKIREGHRVVVDMDASPRFGDIVVAIHQGEALVKILTRRNGRSILTAIQDQPPIEVSEETRILGVVREVKYRP